MKESNEDLRWKFVMPEGKICMEKGCMDKATRDYNGMDYWVCDYHNEKLNKEFEEDYD